MRPDDIPWRLPRSKYRENHIQMNQPPLTQKEVLVGPRKGFVSFLFFKYIDIFFIVVLLQRLANKEKVSALLR